MKKMIFVLIVLTLNSVHSQFNTYKPLNLVLKSGDTLENISGKLKRNFLKYKLDDNSKPKKVDFSEIVSVKIGRGSFKKYYQYFQVDGSDRYVGVEKILEGKNLEVYGLDYNYTNSMAGGMTMSGTATNYYVKKKGESKVTFIGDYDAILGEFKVRVNRYFSDCELLINKLKNKEIRLRDGFKNIAEFYINNCE
jgi:hypothetical protein